MADCEKYKTLLIGLADQELTQDESAEIHDHLNRCGECRKEYNEMLGTGKILQGVSFDEPEDEVLESLWKAPYSRWAKVSGLVLVVGGWVALVVMAIVQIFTDSGESLFSRVTGGAVVIGFIIILLYVIRERMATYKVDRYKGVKR